MEALRARYQESFDQEHRFKTDMNHKLQVERKCITDLKTQASELKATNEQLVQENTTLNQMVSNTKLVQSAAFFSTQISTLKERIKFLQSELTTNKVSADVLARTQSSKAELEKLYHVQALRLASVKEQLNSAHQSKQSRSELELAGNFLKQANVELEMQLKASLVSDQENMADLRQKLIESEEVNEALKRDISSAKKSSDEQGQQYSSALKVSEELKQRLAYAEQQSASARRRNAELEIQFQEVSKLQQSDSTLVASLTEKLSEIKRENAELQQQCFLSHAPATDLQQQLAASHFEQQNVALNEQIHALQQELDLSKHCVADLKMQLSESQHSYSTQARANDEMELNLKAAIQTNKKLESACNELKQSQTEWEIKWKLAQSKVSEFAAVNQNLNRQLDDLKV